jgi:predicted alpha/beta-fold hydrolase
LILYHLSLFTILDIEELNKIKYYRDFDRLVTLKFFEFDSVDDYYIKSSSIYDLQHVNVPSLFINAKDDVLSPVDTIDIQSTFKLNPKIILLLTRWGGHVCWFTGLKPKRVSLSI